MSRNRKPRIDRNKSARHRLSAMFAIEKTRIERQPVPDDFAAEFEMVALTALDVVTRGQGGKSQWDALANCLNHGWLLAKAGIGYEARESFALAQDAMRRMIPEFERSGRVVFASETDQKTVESALALWSQQLRMATLGEIHGATMTVEKHYWKTPEAA